MKHSSILHFKMKCLYFGLVLFWVFFFYLFREYESPQLLLLLLFLFPSIWVSSSVASLFQVSLYNLSSAPINFSFAKHRTSSQFFIFSPSASFPVNSYSFKFSCRLLWFPPAPSLLVFFIYFFLTHICSLL